MIWGSQQNTALKLVAQWKLDYKTNRRNTKQVFFLGGFAGTGKTTLARHFAEEVAGGVLFGAFTGKAASVLRKKGCVGARTIHSMIYIAEVNKKTGVVTFRLNNASMINDVELVIIDECSMVNEKIALDILSFGKPVLVLGDPAQLPPPDGAGYFTNRPPDYMLTDIHRQATDNPIIYLATHVREGNKLNLGDYGESRIVNKISTTDALEADQILAGRNTTRTSLNTKMRRLLEHDSDMPIVNDKLICLKNSSDIGIYNGGMFIVKGVVQQKFVNNYINLNLAHMDEEDGPPCLVKVHKQLFVPDAPKPDWQALKGSHEFDFGYAITCHKSQGSQWENPLIYDESWCFRDKWKEWIYTAITRASEKTTILLS